MKTKQKISLIMLCTVILSPTIFTANAANYDVAVNQNPPEVYAGEIVTVTVTVSNMIREEEITSARISLTVNLAISSVYPEETVPIRENTLTFILGSFGAGDIIKYKVFIDFQLQADRYGQEYGVNEYFTFTIPEANRPLLSVSQISLIIAASVLVLAVIVIIIRRRKK